MKSLSDLSDFAGRTALVTGAARGIGLATARMLAADGARVFVTDSDGEAAETAAASIRDEGFYADALTLDVADPQSVERAFAAVSARHERLDIAISNAGAGARFPAEALEDAAWQRVVDINLTGGFQVARAAGRLMLANADVDTDGDRPAGTIVFVASIMGLVGGGLYPNSAYQATKGALVNLTRALALEWAARGIRVNAVAPGFARTRLTEPLFADPDMADAIIEATPMGRLLEPEEVAAAVAFLASDAASMITGVTLPVDGGWLAR